MNKFKVGSIISTILDFGLTFGGSIGVVIYNYVCPDSSPEYKLSLTGILLLIGLVLTCKTIFEHSFQNKENDLLQQLGMAQTQEVKDEINKKITSHKMQNTIYQRLMVLLPFLILSVVTQMGIEVLTEMNATVNMILMFMGAGSVFNVVKKPLKDKADMIKFEQKAQRK